MSRANRRFHTVLTLTAALLASSTAFGQANAGGQINDAPYPPGFDCTSLGSAQSRVECQTFQARRTTDNAVPPGTPAISMPGQSNSTSGPYLSATPGSQDYVLGKRPAHGEPRSSE
jgi:hypothetical protein